MDCKNVFFFGMRSIIKKSWTNGFFLKPLSGAIPRKCNIWYVLVVDLGTDQDASTLKYSLP